MNSLLLVLLAIIGYILAYRFYGRFLARKIFRLSPEQVMPSHQFNDGMDYVPTKRNIIFGHHFTTIAGLGPIVGPAIGLIWGWLPAFLWVFLGSIFMGAVHDFSTLVVSARNNGYTIGELTGHIISPGTRYVLQFIMQLLLFIVLAVFAMIVATLFVMYPESVIPVWFQIPIAIWLGWNIRRGKPDLVYSIISLLLLYLLVIAGVHMPVNLPWEDTTNVVVWSVLLFVYVFIASTLPVHKLLQPRDYINSHQLLVAMGLIVLGLIIRHPVLSAPAINSLAFAPGSNVPSPAPLMFIVIACGAISGFHALASSGTTVKQVSREPDALPIGYGAMLTESFLAVLVIVSIAGGLGLGVMDGETILTGRAAYLNHYASWESANGLASKLDAFITGTANLFEAFGIPQRYGQSFVAVFIVTFANTTLDSATRIQRLSLQEIIGTGKGKVRSRLRNRYVSTLLIVSAAAALTFYKPGGQGAMILWPLFGSLNQLMGALALGVVTVYMSAKRLPLQYTLLPMIIILIFTVWAMIQELTGFLKEKETLLVILSGVIIILTGWLMTSAVRVILIKRSSPD
ncbi:MAG: carbon starvation protein A [Bacteroidales bacterium]|nr:carbon starvation protein A [Bacteroidales bacterium]MBN2697389.1 carbon starvation protein A [Bacteroidales bacterium]